MPSTAVFTGIILVLIGVFGVVAGWMDDNFSKTALIPAGFGVIIAVLGWIGGARESLRKHVMHVAVLVALLGFIGVLMGPGIRGALSSGTINNMTSFIAQAAMAVVCLVFVALSVKSFIDARRSGAV